MSGKRPDDLYPFIPSDADAIAIKHEQDWRDKQLADLPNIDVDWLLRRNEQLEAEIEELRAKLAAR